MIRNFVAGTLWGAVVAGIGLAVVSQVAPLPQPRIGADVVAAGEAATANPAAVPDGAKPAVPKAELAPAAPARVTPAPATMPQAAPPQMPAASPAKPSVSDPAVAEPKVSMDPQLPAPVEPPPAALPAADVSDDQLALGDAVDAPAAKSAPPSVDDAPAALDAPEVGAAGPLAAKTVDPAKVVAPPANMPAADQSDAPPPPADAPPPAPPPAPEALLDPAPQINTNPAPATIAPDAPVDQPAPLPQTTADAPAAENPATAKVIEADPAPKADVAVLQPVAPPEPAPSLIAKNQPSTFLPDASVTSSAEAVTTGRLPRIGDQPADTADAVLPAVDLPPVQQFARQFDNPSGKPLFAVILRDTGGADLDRAALAALPFPVSFVIDPLAPNAAEVAAIYRAAGQEVIMLATGIPPGAQASDLEQTFQSLAAMLPQAVAVMDMAVGGFQDDRPLASLVVPVVKTQGRGLITFNRGLNAADQVARRIDVPAATIFRQLDAAGEDLPLIRRYLDRAAFKAAQEGRVMVLGDTRPETIAALMEWTIEGRASSVTLAPATAVLSVD